MKSTWKKLGQLFVVEGEKRHPKLVSHAANPLPVYLHDDIFRVFFSGRDCDNRSSVGAVDIDIEQRKVIKEHHFPFLEHGPKGSFYADGVSIGNCYTVDGVQYMLFMGWQSPDNQHWRGDVGRLIVNADITLTLDSDAPFMSADEMDPISLSYPWVLEDGSGGYDMWYGSTRTWDSGNGEMIHVINSAHSFDGHSWHRDGLAIPFEVGVAQAFSRPTVSKNPLGGLEMWFSYRSGTGDTYRIGYATTDQGKQWRLALDETAIDVSPEGWDSEMIEYPFVFDHKGKRYMLYNGNGYGKTGFGLAVLERS
ncbi:glycoside hydrolase family protein [Pseudomonas sp. RT4P38]